MRRGDLAKLVCDERLYIREDGVFMSSPAVVQRGELVTVIQPSESATSMALVLHPRHGLGILYSPSLEAA